MHDAVRRWVEATVGGSIVGEGRPPIGGSARGVPGGCRAADGSRLPLVVRGEGEGSFTATEVSLAREAVVSRALARTPVPTPDVVACSADGTVLVLERLAGTTHTSVISPTGRAGPRTRPCSRTCCAATIVDDSSGPSSSTGPLDS